MKRGYNINNMRIFIAILALYVGFFLFAVPIGVVSSGSVTVIPEHYSKPILSSWTPPHLVSQKTAGPVQIWKKDSGMIPDAATVTLKVTAVGDPTISHKPIDVILLIDTTGSMASQTSDTDMTVKMTATKNACNNFLTYLNFNSTDLALSDRVAVMNFSAPNIQLVQGFTNSQSELTTAINSLTPNGSTNYFDATEYATNQVDHDYMSNHIPIVIALTDGDTNADINYTSNQPGCTQLCKWLSAQHNNTGVIVYTIGFGRDVQPTYLTQIADSTGGKYYFPPDSVTLNQAYKDIADSLVDVENTAAVAPSPTEPMITDVLPPYIEYQGNWTITSNSNATILSFQEIQDIPSGLWKLCWDVPEMRIGEVFEVQYNIKSTMVGWQSVGVNRLNATSVYNASDWCKVKYQNWQYYKTNNPNDIWTNETNDFGINVENLEIPSLARIELSSTFLKTTVGNDTSFMVSAFGKNNLTITGITGATYKWILTPILGTLNSTNGNPVLFTANKVGTCNLSATVSYRGVNKTETALIEVLPEVVPIGNFTVYGIVYGENNKPIKNANITIDSIDGLVHYETHSNMSGYYSFEGLVSLKTYVIICKVTGYKDYKSGNITSAPDIKIIHDIHMSRNSGTTGSPVYLQAVIVVMGLVVAGFLFTVIPPLYSRIRRDKVLDHFIRGQVYDYIRQHPGTHFNGIRANLHLSRGTLGHHIRTLEMQGFIKSNRDGIYKRFYEIEINPKNSNGLRYSKLQRRILNGIKKQPGLCQTELADKIGIPNSVLIYNLKVLVKADAVRIEVYKNKKSCYVTSKPLNVTSNPIENN